MLSKLSCTYANIGKIKWTRERAREQVKGSEIDRKVNGWMDVPLSFRMKLGGGAIGGGDLRVNGEERTSSHKLSNLYTIDVSIASNKHSMEEETTFVKLP